MSARTFALLALFLWFAGAIYVATLFVGGSTETSADGRTRIKLDAAETDFVLGEMRGMLSGIRDITDALAANDPAKVAETARAIGTAHGGNEPASLVLKMPLEMKQFGKETHVALDKLAEAADQGADISALTSQLADVMGRCVACHDTYRFR